MTGPSLREKEPHSAIHRAISSDIEEAMAIVEGKNGTELMEGLKLLLEIWAEKSIRHADVEEQELYPEILATDPSMSVELERLLSQHELLRKLLKKAEDLLKESGIGRGMSDEGNPLTDEILKLNREMLSVLKAHSEEEEDILWRNSDL